MNEQIKDIGLRLRYLREDMEITAEEMAKKLDVDPETYAAYESGDMDFSFSVIYNAAEILGVDVLDLISGSAPTLSMCCMVKKGKGYSVSVRTSTITSTLRTRSETRRRSRFWLR